MSSDKYHLKFNSVDSNGLPSYLQVTPNSLVTLVPVFEKHEPETFKVTFNANGGLPTPDPQMVKKGKKAKKAFC